MPTSITSRRQELLDTNNNINWVEMNMDNHGRWQGPSIINTSLSRHINDRMMFEAYDNFPSTIIRIVVPVPLNTHESAIIPTLEPTINQFSSSFKSIIMI